MYDLWFFNQSLRLMALCAAGTLKGRKQYRLNAQAHLEAEFARVWGA